MLLGPVGAVLLAALQTGSPLPTAVPRLAAGESARASPRLDARRALLLWRITVKLRLDEDAATRVFEVIARYDRRVSDSRHRRAVLMREMQDAVDRHLADETLQALIARWVQLQGERRTIRQARWRELQGMLSPLQQAQLMAMSPSLD